MDPIWLLAFKFAGRTWYLASNACAPTRADGTTVPHLPTLATASFTEALNLGGGITGPCSASCSFSLGLPLDRDVWWMVLEGYQLAQALGELALWTPGTDYEERLVLVSGPFIPQKVPTPGKPLEGDFQDLVGIYVSDWPPSSAQINATTWPNAPLGDDANLNGTPYPWVFGAPGATTVGGVAYTIPASPCWIIDTTPAAQKGLICGAPVDATTVKIAVFEPTPFSDTFSVTTEADGSGRYVATVDLSSKDGAWTLDGTVNLYVVDWGTGGVQEATGPNVLMGLGEAIVYLLLQRYAENGPERVDVASWQALAPILGAWKVGFYVSDPGDPMDQVKVLLDSCPALWIVGGPRGLRPIFLANLPAALRRTLTEGREIHWVEDAMTLGDVKICNDFTTNFGHNIQRSVYNFTQTDNETTNPAAAASQSRPWGRRSDSVESPVYDPGVAALVASEQIRMRWTQPILLDYEMPMWAAMGIALGEAVLVDDPDRGIDARAVWVLGREFDMTKATVKVTFAGWW